jgi:Ca2+-binding RTX toxin-like protein/V8-like Glu-specific endopeptidase
VSTVFIDADDLIGSGQTVVSSDSPAFELYSNYVLDPSAPDPTLTIAGELRVNSASAAGNVEAVYLYSTNAGSNTGRPSLLIAQGGTLSVNDTGASHAYGFIDGQYSDGIENDGTIAVTAAGAGTGVLDSQSAYSFVNTGTLQVTADQAVGADVGYLEHDWSNSGSVIVHGGASAVGYYFSDVASLYSYFDNSGTITVSDSNASAIGLVFDGGAGQVINSGTITANTAIDSSNAPLRLTNTGTINGTIVGADFFLSPGTTDATYEDQISNTGAIHGDIHLDNDAGATYDGRGGTLTGGIYLGTGTYTIYLGNDGETVHSGGGSVLVFSGSGNDTIDGGSSGSSTISYAGATAVVNINLALQGQAQDTGGGGVDTLTNFQNIIGSAYGGTLTGDANNNNITVGLGANLTGPFGRATLDGGGGVNTVSFDNAGMGVGISLALQGQVQQLNQVQLYNDTVVLTNFQNLTGSAFNDLLEGNSDDNVLNGGGGENTVSYWDATAGVHVSLALQGQAQNTGGAGNDTLLNFSDIMGSQFNDTLEGDDGDNNLNGMGGVNTVSYAHAGAGVTVSLMLQGGPQNTIGAGVDTLGNFQNLTGSAFDDTLEGTDGNNVLDGGAGNNTVTYARASAGVNVSLALQGQAQNTGGSGIDTLLNFQNVNGSAFDDTLEGDGNNNILDGRGGTNTVSYAHASAGVTVGLELQGSAQNTGGAGTDILYNFQNLTGSAFNDTLEGDGNNNVLDGGGGTNTVSYAHATSGVTVSLALQGAAQTTVGAGTDTLSNFQNLTGSAFNDTLEGSGGNNVLDGGTGTNTVSYAHAASGVTVSLALQNSAQNTGGSGTDTLSNFQNIIGSAFADHLTGDANNNVIDGGGGDDALDGGGGTNTVSFASANAGVTVSLALAGQAQSTGVGSDTLSNFQNLTGSAFNDTLEGDGGVNVLDGGAGTNTVSYAHATTGVNVSLSLQGSPQNTGWGTETLSNFQNLTGSAFNDTLEGDGNNNVLDGGAGTNTVSYAHASTGVTVSLALQGQAQNTFGAGTDTLSNFQNLTGSVFNDTLEGDSGNNVLQGGAGINTVSYAHATAGVTVNLALEGLAQSTVGAGVDTLFNFNNVTGSAFNDTIGGDIGDNVLDGGAGINTVTYALAPGAVNVSLALQGSAQNTVGAGNDTLSHFQNLTGSGFNDTLEGDGGDNVLDGAGGTNTVSYAHAASGVTVSLALEGSAQNTIGAGTDTLSNFQNLTGSAFNDTLEGDSGNNVLDGSAGINTVSYAHALAGVTVSLDLQGQAQNTGSAGSDTLSHFQAIVGSAFNDTLEGGGAASTTLTGGLGADTFVYRSGDQNVTVTDFSHAQGDQIDLSALSQFGSLADVLAAATQSGANTVINTGSGSLILQNVSETSLAASDFQFHHTTTTTPALAYPYDAVCLITDTVGNEELQGSGVIIGPHTILTASHMLWDAGTGQSATNVTVYPGYTGSGSASVAGTTIHYNTVNDANDLISQAQSQNDFAIIDVSQDLSSYGSFGVSTNFGGGPVSISGYPATSGGSQLDTSGSATQDPTYSLIDYSSAFGVSPGSSGGPIWINEVSSGNALPYVVGVVSTATWGAQLTTADLTQIQGWVAQDASLWGGSGSGSVIGVSAPNPGIGYDLILQPNAGFEASQFSAFQDEIDLSAFANLHTLADILAVSTQVGANTVISPDGVTSLVLDNVQKSSLQLSDFVLASGAATPNVIHVSAGDHILTWGENWQLVGGVATPVIPTETIVFQPGGGSAEIEQGFIGSGDTIDLSAFPTLTSFSAILADAVQVGANTVINLPGGGTVTLDGVSVASLTAPDFGFPSPPPPSPPLAITPLSGTSANNYIATLAGSSREYTLGADGATVTGGPTNTYYALSNIQRIQFVDGYETYSTSDPAAEVYRLYEATLKRAPDQEGLTSWVNALNGGTTLQSVANGFVSSTEFQQDYGNLNNSAFVNLLYENVLHRGADQTGLNFWLGQMSGGMTQAQVVLGFSESTENINDSGTALSQGLWVGNTNAAEVARLYDTTLQRLPDLTGLTFWTNQLQTGASLQSVVNGFTSSTEFQNTYGALSNNDFVTLLYNNTLHRGPDPTGLTFWVGQLTSNTQTRAQVVLGFSDSTEHIADTAPHIDGGIWLA